MFYGVVQEEYLYEFDIKQGVTKVIEFIGKKIGELIEKAKKLLERIKNSKLVTAIKTEIEKLKKLDKEKDNIATQEQADAAKRELEEAANRVKDIESIAAKSGSDSVNVDKPTDIVRDQYIEEFFGKKKSGNEYTKDLDTSKEREDIKNNMQKYKELAEKQKAALKPRAVPS